MSSSTNLTAGVVMLAFGAAVAVGGGTVAFNHMTQDDVTFTVNHKERVNLSKDDSRYMVWATKADGQKEVFEDTDSWSFMKFNSADVYGNLQDGKTYKAHVAGVRVPFLSWNRNIISVTPQ
jgi:hypothetical protein